MNYKASLVQIVNFFKTIVSKIWIFALKLIHFESFTFMCRFFSGASTNYKEILNDKNVVLLFAFQTIHLIHISLKIVYLCQDCCSLAPSHIKRVEKQAANHNFIINMTWMISSVHQSQSSTGKIRVSPGTL